MLRIGRIASGPVEIDQPDQPDQPNLPNPRFTSFLMSARALYRDPTSLALLSAGYGDSSISRVRRSLGMT
jgi:hypothetical protein